MDDPSAILSKLPEPLKGVLGYGIGFAMLGSTIYKLVAPMITPTKRKSDVADPAPNPDAKAIGLAIAAPLSDANQFRQAVEALNRLNEFASIGIQVSERIESAVNRVEQAANRAGDGARAVEQAVHSLTPR